MTKLTLADIADIRAYEREREAFRAHVIALKRRRRVGVGPFVTLVFENRDTVRFQIQEMARVERLDTDEAIEAELRAYNPLIPEPGHLTATMFLELTTPDDLRRWLPALAGIERTVALDVAGDVIDFRLDADHEKQLTRDETTSAVHYLRVALDAAQVERAQRGPLAIVVDHPEYRHRAELSAVTIAELVGDLRGA